MLYVMKENPSPSKNKRMVSQALVNKWRSCINLWTDKGSSYIYISKGLSSVSRHDILSPLKNFKHLKETKLMTQQCEKVKAW